MDCAIRFTETSMRRDLREIFSELQQIAEREATYLYRLAWRMKDHGCDPAHIEAVREEARRLHMMGHPEWLLDSSVTWQYAFKIR